MIASRKVIEGLPLFALAAACTAVGILAATLFQPVAVLDRGIGQALAKSRTPGKAVAQAPSRLADSPHFHLSRHDSVPFGLAKPIAVGDHINITGSSGLAQTLEVINIREIDAGLTQLEQATAPRFLVVTCRELSATGAQLVRFIIESDEPDNDAAGRPQRTL